MALQLFFSKILQRVFSGRPKNLASRTLACGISTTQEKDLDQHFKAQQEKRRNGLAGDR
jgi:hypothetical protein